MKFICLGYGRERDWDAMSKSEQAAVVEECFAYDEELLRNGHWLEGGQALQSSRTAKSLRLKNGEVIVTDGPFAETKELLGGIGVLEARDFDHAVAILSSHPSLRCGISTEIRPIDDEKVERQMASAMECGETDRPPTDEAGTTMKFACLGYIDQRKWDGKSKSDFDAMIQECVAFDEARRRDGQWLSGIKLQGAEAAKTLRWTNDKAMIIDGPFAETKEQLGGAVVLGLNDMNHAIELMSKHPALGFGVTIEVRPIHNEINARWEAREEQAKKIT
jgi:hypothetical protein